MIQERSILLSSAYFGPVQYFSKLVSGNPVFIEQHDHYIKQTYRNRAVVLSANGQVALNIPVSKPNGNKTKTCDVLIYNEESWQRMHLRTLTAAYKNSPFFEFYIDALMPVFEKTWKYLIDLNCYTLELMANEIEQTLPYTLTDEYTQAEDALDYRELISPKKDSIILDTHFEPVEYRQVFWDRFSFQANLSILDLLFNKGPETIDYLMNSIK